MHILIVGGGKTVYFLCRNLLSKGYKVTLINGDHAECTWLARHLKATIVNGDGGDPNILEEAGANTADVVLAVTPNDHDNLVICQVAGLRFGVPQTLALVNDPDNEEVFRQLGITAVSTTRILSTLIEQRVGFDEIKNLITADEGKVNITEIELRETSPMIGKQLRDIAFPENSLVVYILRQDQPIIPRGSTVFHTGDHIFVITLPENYGEVIRMITGDTR